MITQNIKLIVKAFKKHNWENYLDEGFDSREIALIKLKYRNGTFVSFYLSKQEYDVWRYILLNELIPSMKDVKK